MTKKEKADLTLKQLKLKLRIVKSKGHKIDSSKIVQKKKDKGQLSKLNLMYKIGLS